MSSSAITKNFREVVAAVSTITNTSEYVTSTNGRLNVNASVSISGSPIPVTGATTGLVVAIVDGSGNQITSFGGGTQYAELVTTAPATGTVALARYKSTPVVLTDGQLYAPQLDVGGNLKTSILSDGVISTANSTTANLAGGAVFTGTAEDVSDYSAIQVSIFSSHASASDGISLQQSSNGTNWDITDVYTIAAVTGKVFSIQPAAQYFRLVYTNGATLTTSLRIQVVYHVIAPNPSSQRPSDAYTNETDLTQGWAFNSLFNGTTWDRVRGDITNGMDVDVTRLPTLANVTTVGTVTTLTGTTSLTPGTAATNLGKAEDAAHTTGDVGVMGLAVRQSTPIDLSAGATNGDYEPTQVGRDGGLWVAGIAAPQGGWSVATGTIAATKTDIGTANTTGQVGGWYIYNPNASVAYVQFFNTQASGVTLGTTPPVYSLGIPATSAANIAPGMVGINHATAISIAVTTTRSGSTGPGSTVDFNIWYKQ